MTSPEPLPDSWFYALVLVGILLNATGLVPPIMEPDGALYASIAKTMAQTSDLVNLMAQGADWLDKPHFPFWITALSYRVFGVNSFAYKFPALLFWLAGIVYTHRFAQLVYPKLVAQIATLIVLTPYHLVLSNNDVRAEPYLTGLVVGSVYHFYRVFLGGRGLHLILGALLMACTVMTKGPFVLVPVGAGLVGHWLIVGQGRELLRPRWYLALALTVLFTTPELYCLYRQFDLHPEKIIFGQTGVSGVRFFFWDSQFGRFFNTGPIRGAGDPFFFLHTLLWAFLPWSLLLYSAVGKAIWGLIKRTDPLPEYVSLGSGLATLLLFSLSSFQLPHYLNLVFPFYAILSAHFLVSLRSEKALRTWTWIQSGIGVLMAILAVLLLVLFRPVGTGWAVARLVTTGAVTLRLFHGTNLLTLLGRTIGATVLLYGFLNLFLFPDMLQYQAGMKAADFLNDQPPGVVGVYGEGSYSFEFYLKQPLYFFSDSTLRQATARQRSVRVFTSAKSADSLLRKGFSVKTLGTFPHFHVSQPSLEFINHQTRPAVLEPYVVAEVRHGD